jgi:hypothetical protein
MPVQINRETQPIPIFIDFTLKNRTTAKEDDETWKNQQVEKKYRTSPC